MSCWVRHAKLISHLLYNLSLFLSRPDGHTNWPPRRLMMGLRPWSLLRCHVVGVHHPGREGTVLRPSCVLNTRCILYCRKVDFARAHSRAVSDWNPLSVWSEQVHQGGLTLDETGTKKNDNKSLFKSVTYNDTSNIKKEII